MNQLQSIMNGEPERASDRDAANRVLFLLSTGERQWYVFMWKPGETGEPGCPVLCQSTTGLRAVVSTEEETIKVAHEQTQQRNTEA